MNKDDMRACQKACNQEMSRIIEERGSSFGIMVDTDDLAREYQRRVRLGARLYYRMHPKTVPDMLCLVHIQDRRQCGCQK